ncbi:MAG: serine protease [Bacteroidales bacterium]|nr:serine protease [Bacteroidales bacterium]
MKRGIILALLAFVFFGCNKSEQEINEEFSSGVVLIKNTGYYEMKISDEISIYFTNYSEENGLENFTTEEDSIIVSTSFGTGFFVSANGEIATNNHVVSPAMTEKDALKIKNNVIKETKNELRVTYNYYDEALTKINNALLSYLFADYYDSDYYELKEAGEYCEEQMRVCSQLFDYFSDVDVSNVDCSYINEVSVAYNDEYVTSTTDFIPCVLKKVDAENDLAIIQLKNKKTPESRHIFEIPEENPIETTSLFYPDKNEKLFMIGFNLGPMLALTKEGVRSQCTTGAITQDRENSYMYSISSLQGSSGAPVLNRKGELVAINFAGIGSTQNFNYGIKVKYLRELLNK